MSLDFLNDKTILITGGTGSFGQKCVRMLLEKSGAKKIIIFSRDELKQLRMQNELSDPDVRLRFFIGDVRDIERLRMAFRGVDYVIHAAALKQVPTLEYNPFEAIKTNIIGTQNVIGASLDCGVKRIVFVSTDKAANPANLYGATKLCAERLIISSNSYSGDSGTLFAAVRYGNVFGSRGSLVKIIEDQRVSGEVTLTHEEMTRFWITLEEGVSLVLMALEKMKGGEIFIPKIPSMRVKDFIQVLAPECSLRIIGIRPGEKVHEVLITPEEARHTKEYDDYYVILPEYDWWTQQEYFTDGKSLDEGFVLASHKNKHQLDAEGLKKLLQTLQKI